MNKTLVAVTSFVFEGRTYAPGEVFDVTPIKALALTYNKKAKFAPPGMRTRELSPESAPEKPTSKRRYRRRDMQPER